MYTCILKYVNTKIRIFIQAINIKYLPCLETWRQNTNYRSFIIRSQQKTLRSTPLDAVLLCNYNQV